MNLIAIAQKSIKRLMLVGTVSTVLTGVLTSVFLAPSNAQSATKTITLGDRVEPNPLAVVGQAGGDATPVEIVATENTATGSCNGFISEQPNHILVLDSFFEFLKLEVSSPSDTTMIVQGPGGVWCNDDSNDANPVIGGQWQPGKYNIWVGSYQENTKDNYQLSISD